MKFESLNNQQIEAVKCTNKNSIILACPGSGKTHTIISKIVYMINKKNVDPKKIILITFTNKTSEEMKYRLDKKLKNKKIKYVGTFHGLSYRVLQDYDNINYTMLDDKEFPLLIENIFLNYLDENHLTMENEEKIYLIKCMIDIYGTLTSEFPKRLKEIISDKNLQKYYNIFNGGFEYYNTYKKQHKLLDFGDLMINFFEFLCDEKRSEEFKKSYDYILFDEYQDINNIQNSILIEMNKGCNLTVVGDDAQSIYAFRGSNNSYILNFEKYYDNVNKFMLENNYRSTPEIINFCNAIIDNSYGNLDKKMIPINDSNNIKPFIKGFSKNYDEMKYIIKEIKNNYSNNIKLKDQVIIARKNKQLDFFELYLIENKISYIKNNSISILDKIHIKDYLAFLKILHNSRDLPSWKRILTLHFDNINNVDDILDIMSSMNISMIDIISGPEMYLSNYLCNKLKKLTDLYCSLYLSKGVKSDLNGFCNEIIKYIRKFINRKSKIRDEVNVRRKISELICLKNYIVKLKSLDNFFKIISDDDKIGDEDDYLLLSTMHGCKGLEWDNVYISGCSSDIVPSMRIDLYKKELENFEEERRLFYVACSRAKKKLEITLSYEYHYISNYIYVTPFISNIPEILYNSDNLNYARKIVKGDVTRIINNYLIINGSHNIYPYLRKLEYNKEKYYDTYNFEYIIKNKLDTLYGTFIDNLICKMVYRKYKDLINKMNVPVYERNRLRYDKNYNTYIDPNNDWKDSNVLRSILNISRIDDCSECNNKYLFNFLNSKKSFEMYNNIDKMMIDIIDNALDNSIGKKYCPESKINLHHNISFDIKGEADLVVGRTLIEIKTSKHEIATVRNILQTIIYRYMLRTKDIRIDNIILLNPLSGEVYDFKITPKWKDTFRVFNIVMS